ILADAVQQQRLEIREDQSQELRAEINHHEQRQVIGLLRNDEPIDRVLGELWLQDAEQVQHQRQHQRRDQLLHVWLQVTKQAPRDLPVVGLADLLFFVKLFDRCGHKNGLSTLYFGLG